MGDLAPRKEPFVHLVMTIDQLERMPVIVQKEDAYLSPGDLRRGGPQKTSYRTQENISASDPRGRMQGVTVETTTHTHSIIRTSIHPDCSPAFGKGKVVPVIHFLHAIRTGQRKEG